MASPIDDLEPYNVKNLPRVSGFRECVDFVLNRRLYRVPKDEPKPIENMLRWNHFKTTREDRKRVSRWHNRRTDEYWIPKEVVKMLKQQAACKGTAKRDQSGPPSYEAVCKTPQGSERGGPSEPTLPTTHLPLSSLPGLRTKAGRIFEKYASCYIQITAAEAALDEDLSRASEARGQSATGEVADELKRLSLAILELKEEEWAKLGYEPLQENLAVDVEKVSGRS